MENDCKQQREGNEQQYLAHTREDGAVQILQDHLLNTGKLCKQFAQEMGCGENAKIMGDYHDYGKYNEKFQRRIRGSKEQVDHSTAGAYELSKMRMCDEAVCVAGHHTGIPKIQGNDSSLQGRLKQYDKEPIVIKDKLCGCYFPKQPQQEGTDFLEKREYFSWMAYIRMLYSCLVDADFLDTESFMQGANRSYYFDKVEMLEEKVFQKVKEYLGLSVVRPINKIRNMILQACIDKGKEEPGIYSLSVPTGGGKTFASLAFAFSFMKSHPEYKRVIYVIPYTSIIEQTVLNFRRIVGENNVLEHYSGVSFEDSDAPKDGEETAENKRLATENWNAPLIVTTNEQFFESLFSNKSSHCRKLHNIIHSVVIFDEVQALPLGCLRPCTEMIEVLARDFHVTEVLCTATQPALEIIGLKNKPKEMVQGLDALDVINVFKRNKYEFVEDANWEVIAKEMMKSNQCLAVVNYKRGVSPLGALLPNDDSSFCLSTNLIPDDRQRRLEEIRNRICKGLTCRVVSTSLIEAGVDLDFPLVFREKTGLDSILQAGGRCNREGVRDMENSKVIVFSIKDSKPPQGDLSRRICALQESMEDDNPIDSPTTIQRYFRFLYDLTGNESLDSHHVDQLCSTQDFPEISQQFKLIDQDTKQLIIPKNEEISSYVQQLSEGFITREQWRILSRYILNIYPKTCDTLCKTHCAHQIDDNLFVLDELEAYSEKYGLNSELQLGDAIFI